MENCDYYDEQFSYGYGYFYPPEQLLFEPPLEEEVEFCESYPPGWLFKPTDQELIKEYLSKKVKNQILPKNRIHDVSLYHYTPQDLTGMYNLVRETEWYFFTHRNRKYPNGSRPDRAVPNGNGYWKPTGKEKEIKDEDGVVIGSKRALDFYEGNIVRSTRTNWKMHEYIFYETSLPPTPMDNALTNSMQLDQDWILCKVYEKKQKEGGDQDEENQQEI